MPALDDLLAGGNLTPEAKALGFSSDDLAGGHFADEPAALAVIEKAAAKAVVEVEQVEPKAKPKAKKGK